MSSSCFSFGTLLFICGCMTTNHRTKPVQTLDGFNRSFGLCRWHPFGMQDFLDCTQRLKALIDLLASQVLSDFPQWSQQKTFDQELV